MDSSTLASGKRDSYICCVV